MSEENCLKSHDGTQEGEGEAFIVIKHPTEPKTKKAGSDTYPVEEEVEGKTEPFLVKGIQDAGSQQAPGARETERYMNHIGEE